MKHELSTFKKGSLSGDDYLTVLSKKAYEVKDAGTNLDNEELALIACDGLDSSYNAFVTVVTASAGDLTFVDFRGLFRAFEKRHAWETETPFPSANLAQRNPSTPRSGEILPLGVSNLLQASRLRDRMFQPT